MSAGDALMFAESEEMLTLRRDIVGLRQALRSRDDTIAALQTRIDRLEHQRRAICAANFEHHLRIEKLEREYV